MPFFDHGLCDRCAGGFESLCDGPEKGKASIAGGLTIQRWAMRDVACGFAARSRFGPAALACCAGKRFAFPQLRTLSGSNPMKWAQTKTVPFRGPFPIQRWAMRDVACGFAARSRFGPAALACCAGKRLRVSSAPHPVGFESHALGPKKKGPHCWEPIKSVVGDEGFEPPALCV